MEELRNVERGASINNDRGLASFASGCVSYNDSALDRRELDEVLLELREE